MKKARIYCMKLFFAFLVSSTSYGQWITKKEIAPMLLTAMAGYSTGWRDEVLYHPNQLFNNHPNLNRKFWDNRVQSDPKFLNMELNADHVLKGTTVFLFTAAIAFKIGDKKKWYWYIVDGAKYFLCYHAGFYLSYNVQNHNKFL